MAVKVKICGIKNLEMAQFCEEAGADFIGLNFVPESPRYIDVAKGVEIASGIKKAKVVGVFTNQDVQEVCEKVNLDFIQIHGDREIESILGLKIPIIKAVSIESKNDLENLDMYKKNVQYFLFDKKHSKLAGGTGESFNWDILSNFTSPLPYFLAGGLNPENVHQAIQQTSAFAVDVASGVEQDGNKDKNKIINFINSAKSL